MPDNIVNFPLRDATSDQLAAALGGCLVEYNSWHAQAGIIAKFTDAARTADVKSVLTTQLQQVLDFAATQGLFAESAVDATRNPHLVGRLAEDQLTVAEYGVKIAAIVLVHSALERCLWRLVRFGLVAERGKALEWIKDRKISVHDVSSQGTDGALDTQIEKWWEELDNSSLLKKWDSLAGLVGFPPKMNDPPWYFDRAMLEEFDGIRHNAVHHDGRNVRNFAFTEFAEQLGRAQWIWIIHIGLLMKLKLSSEKLVLPMPAGHSSPT